MRILLTGAAGFIGSHLAERFLKDGHQVIGVDNLITGREENLASFLHNPAFQFLEQDVAQPLEFSSSFDWIMHFASPASPSKYFKFPMETLRVNSEGTRHLLDLALKQKAQYFLASTSEIYGDPFPHPQAEDYWGNVNPIGVRSVYDEAKRYAEALTSAYHRQHGLPIRIVRIFNTYGPRMDPGDGRVVSNFINQALRGEPLTIYGKGDQTRSFQFIDDLLEGIVKLMDASYFHPVNLGNPEEFSILELANIIRELTCSSSTLRFEELPPDDPRQRKPDIALAKRLLNWEPRIPLKEGISKTIEYYKK